MIIGGGMAGLTAARKLSKAGVNVTLVESTNRLGGRLRNINIGGKTFSMAASFLDPPTEAGNPIWDIAQKLNLKGRTPTPKSYVWFNDKAENISVKAKGYVDNEVIPAMIKLGKLKVSPSYASMSPLSLRAALMLKNWKPDVTDSVRNVVEWVIFDYISCLPPDVAVLRRDSTLRNSLDRWYVTDARGHQAIADAVANEFKNENVKIELGSVVTDVSYTKDKVSVKTNTQTYQADFGIVTFSVGVLQSDAVKFTPALPTEKLNAIYNRRMQIEKIIYMEFPSTWSFPSAWADFDLIVTADAVKGYYPMFINTGQFFSETTNVLGFTVTGSDAERLSTMSDSQIQAEIMTILRRFDQNVSDPYSMFVSKWESDVFTKGAYSLWSPGFTKDHFLHMKKPTGRLYFAGEAMNEKYSGSVRGAYLSGIEQANAILDCIKHTCAEQ